MKKEFIAKKILCVVLATCSAVFCASCSEQKTYSLFGDAKWLNESVNETCVYGIEYQKPEDDESSLSVVINPESTLTTKLTHTSYEGTPCYLFETAISIKGTYSYNLGGENELSIEIEDETTSKCYFLKDKLSPIYSEKIIKNTSPYSLSSGYSFLKTHYSVTNVYDKANAKLTCTIKNLCDDENDDKENGIYYYKLKNSERVYDNYDKNYIDNELMLLLARTCALEEGYYQTFTSLDATAEKINTLKLSVNSSAPTFEYAPPVGYEKDGVTIGGKLNAYSTIIAINSTFSGSSLYYGYCADAAENKRLLTIKTEYAYSAGSLYYYLKSVKTK